IVVELTATGVAKAAEAQKQAALLRELEEARARDVASAKEAEAMAAVLAEEKVPDVMRRCMIDPDDIDYARGKKLGAGAYGEVWAAKYNGTPVAVKKLHRHKLDEHNLKAFRDEFELQLSLRHPNIVAIIGGSWSLDDVNVCIVFEVCERGSLDGLLRKEPTRSTLSWAKHKLPIATGVARGMAHLHSQNPPVLHRDLKPDNVLIDDGYNAKLADFGCSREVDLTRTMETAGTPLFSAPELLRREHYDEKADVWSFACVLECLWTHRQVFEAVLLARERETGYAENVLRLIENDRLRPKVGTGCFLAPLVAACSDKEPEQRPSFVAIVEQLSASGLVAAAWR
ncbi:MAG: protein kinase, partial [Pseudomonadota bacterium]|nr:protein kinase [Pseudomonadota bacterium]